MPVSKGRKKRPKRSSSRSKSPSQQKVGPPADMRALEAVTADLHRSLRGGGGQARDEAQDFIYEAWETDNPARRMLLAKQALEIWPDCADAYVIGAELMSDRNKTLELYEQGVTAGERAVGKQAFIEDAGHFWGLLETRPYMRARLGLALTLWRLGRREEAIDHYREMLQLNPNDNQGIRYLLLPALIEMDRDDDAWALLEDENYRDDATANWAYGRALLTFRRHGQGPEAKEALGAGIGTNPHVPDYLLGRKEMPEETPHYVGFGDENEAIAYTEEQLPAWQSTSGALEWLSAEA